MAMSRERLAGMIDYSLLRANATAGEIKRICAEAKKYGFNSVCINPDYIRLAKAELAGSDVGVTAVLAYPLGATLPVVKAFEAMEYVSAGADELDMVMNIGAFKSGDYKLVEKEIGWVADVAKRTKEDTVVKVIIETGFLKDNEIAIASKMVKKAGADFVKSGTGWGKGATAKDIKLIRKAVGKKFGVKAAGGIATAKQALELMAAGANRIGTSSAVKIMEEF